MSTENTNVRGMWNNNPIYGVEFEYKMPKAMAKALIAAENRKISDPQKFLIDYVNNELGLRGHCTRVVVS